MPYARDHYRLTYTGLLGPGATPQEQFSFGLSLDVEDQSILTIEQLQQFAADCSPALDNITGLLTSSVRITRIRVARIGTDGKTKRNGNGSYMHGDHDTLHVGAATGSTPPPTVALAISLRSGLEDPTGRGRFFLPMPRTSVASDLRMDVTEQGAWATAAQSFVNAINVAAGVRGTVCIASQGSALRAIPADNRLVTSVAVGRVYDTMRSRRNALEEEYVDRPVTL